MSTQAASSNPVMTADLGKPPRADYYAQGSMEAAETSGLVLNRLEAVSIDSSKDLFFAEL
jgi:hypothetical protein